MPTANITITALSQTVGRTPTISGPDLVRFIAAHRALYNMPPPATDNDVIIAWANRVILNAQGVVRRYEELAALAAAASSTSDIGFVG